MAPSGPSWEEAWVARPRRREPRRPRGPPYPRRRQPRPRCSRPAAALGCKVTAAEPEAWGTRAVCPRFVSPPQSAISVAAPAGFGLGYDMPLSVPYEKNKEKRHKWGNAWGMTCYHMDAKVAALTLIDRADCWRTGLCLDLEGLTSLSAQEVANISGLPGVPSLPWNLWLFAAR